MLRVLSVGLGGAAGSILRYWIGGLVQARLPGSSFPVGTLVVNVAGCLTIGVLAELVEARGFLRPDARSLVVVGLLGGFTTFSAFAHETVTAAEDGAVSLALTNVVATLGLCLGAAWAGRVLAHLLWR